MSTRTLRSALEWRQGDDYDYEFWMLDSDSPPLPINFASAVLKFTVKESITDTDASAIISKEIDTGISLQLLEYGESLFSNSLAVISISNAETTPLEVGRTYLFDLVYNVTVGGKRYTVVDGTIKILPQVTKNN